jgi:hypothetical protein
LILRIQGTKVHIWVLSLTVAILIAKVTILLVVIQVAALTAVFIMVAVTIQVSTPMDLHPHLPLAILRCFF